MRRDARYGAGDRRGARRSPLVLAASAAALAVGTGAVSAPAGGGAQTEGGAQAVGGAQAEEGAQTEGGRQAVGGAQAESEDVVRYRALAASSSRPIDLYNLGTALLHDGQLVEAQSPLQQSIESERPEVRQSAFYNLGLSSALDGRLAQNDASARRAALQSAREAFRSVLRARADDDDARWNLELVERWLEEEDESGGEEQQSGEGESPQGSGAGAATAAGSGEMEMLSPEEAAALLEQAGDAEAAIRDRVMGRNRFQDPVVERNW